MVKRRLGEGSGGPGAQPPEKFWEILLLRVHFYNRVHFFTAVFNMLKMILYTYYLLPNTNFLILIFNRGKPGRAPGKFLEN